MSTTVMAAPELPGVETMETPEKRRSRISLGVLLIVLGIGLGALLTSIKGTASFAFSGAFDDVQLPVVEVPGFSTLLVCALLVLAGGVLILTGKVHRGVFAATATIAGIALVVGFLTWAAAGRDLPFPVSNQMAGTLALATPLIFGALTGVLGERSGVVNVSIEGQFLSAAFTAALVGSITDSLTWALIAAALSGILMASLLALFSIKYLVDQVVLGVVLNLLASGLTGYLYDQLVQPDSLNLNLSPTLPTLPIPGLSSLPFIGPVFFNQTILAYMAAASVVLVWFLLYRTKWGLRVRAVGEHPRAADTVGVPVKATRWSAVLLGGLFAGLGGAFFTLATTGQFTKDMTVGNGFIALAAVIMGRWRPGLAAVMALFFGFVKQLASQVQALKTPVPSDVLLLLPYVATIIAVAGVLGRSRAPAADGVPYVK